MAFGAQCHVNSASYADFQAIQTAADTWWGQGTKGSPNPPVINLPQAALYVRTVADISAYSDIELAAFAYISVDNESKKVSCRSPGGFTPDPVGGLVTQQAIWNYVQAYKARTGNALYIWSYLLLELWSTDKNDCGQPGDPTILQYTDGVVYGKANWLGVGPGNVKAQATPYNNIITAQVGLGNIPAGFGRCVLLGSQGKTQTGGNFYLTVSQMVTDANDVLTAPAAGMGYTNVGWYWPFIHGDGTTVTTIALLRGLVAGSGSKSTYLQNAILSAILGGTAFTAPATIYIGLYTTNPVVGMGGGVEVAGNGYARVAVPNNPAHWSTPASGESHNRQAITFPKCTGAWGTITGVGLFDASSGGNGLYWGALSVSKAPVKRDQVYFDVSALAITQAGQTTAPVGSPSTYLANLVMGNVFAGVSAMPHPATVYLALFTTNPAQMGAGAVEVSGNAYARIAITNTVPANWTTPSSGASRSAQTRVFPKATGSWGTLTGFGIYDASSAGNLLYWGDLTTHTAIGLNDVPQFVPTGLNLQEL